jgi:hypothetical protein
MNKTYEVYCSCLIEDDLVHDYNMIEDSSTLTLKRSSGKFWIEEFRNEEICVISDGLKGIYVKQKGEKGFYLNGEQELQLLILLLHRNDTKIQIKESLLLKEI